MLFLINWYYVNDCDRLSDMMDFKMFLLFSVLFLEMVFRKIDI